MKYILLPITALSLLFQQDRAVGVVTYLEADASVNTYDLINEILAPGHNVVEVSDCSHPSFGAHITQVYDSELDKDVFVFHAHVEKDSDRCKRFDKQRTEIKTYGPSPASTLGTAGETHHYSWDFKLDRDFQASAAFTHIHQIKAVGGPQENMPNLTFTLRDKSDRQSFELRYASADQQQTLVRQDMADFLGEWIHVEEKILFGEDGRLEVTLSRKRDNRKLLTYQQDLRMWKDEARFLRPKWGIYRGLKHAHQLRDEQVKFADFKIIELR
ncbi:heparin lyase I family protein [Nonlabens xiamenensis]|uniref:heparin lyase I family protein n=1 Tax=Nonlabens xiamenensis TaxID=2341043 RepID=UPI000F60A626|nr:heparin lyase I family protein [Nonlabens xiamenensis]